jgi:Ca2+-binding RTX toxin-like protein
MATLFGRILAATTSTILVVAAIAAPATAATPEGTIAALLLQVLGGRDNENPGTASGTGFNCNRSSSNAAFDGDFPESGPCLQFFSTERTITLTASPRATYVFEGWACDFGFFTTPVITFSTASIAFTGSGSVPDCKAQFQTSACFVPPDDGEDLVAGQVAECPADDPDDPIDCPEDAIVGDENDNTLNGTEGDDIICGLAGNDTINGLGGNDLIFGGSGNDTLNGGDGEDVLVGDSNTDILFGGDGGDALLGGTGDDRLDGQAGDDAIAGGVGADVMLGAGGNDGLVGGDGADLMIGGPGDDQLDGQGGRDTLFGCGGSDKLDGDGSDDNLFGDVDDAEGECQSGAGEPDAGNNVPARDVLIGGPGEDRLFGTGGNDTLRGMIGDDTLDGGSGNDVLFGMLGNDVLIGGDGNDLLRGGPGFDGFNAADGQTDTLHGGDDCDFASGLFDQGLDVLFSIEEPDDECIIPLP